MGEIGISRHEFYYELCWWEVKAVVRGYNRRHRHLWSVTRWQTYNLMSAQAGSEALKKAGIYKPTDLIKFPWEKNVSPVSDEDIADLQAEIDAINNNKQETEQQ